MATASEETMGQAERDRSRREQSRPPIVALVLGILLAALVHLVIMDRVAVEQRWRLLVVDGGIILVAGLVGLLVRRSYRDTERGEEIERWEAPYGTLPISLACLGPSLAFCYWAYRYQGYWSVIATAGLLTCVLAAVSAREHPMLKPGAVILSGEQPEDLEKYERREYRVTAARNGRLIDTPVQIWINKATLEAFERQNMRTHWSNNLPRFDLYVTDGRCDEVNELADRLTEISRGSGLTRLDAVKMVMQLVQDGITYTSDLESTGHEDYWKYPLETLASKKGDCEDTAILAVSLLSAMGFRTCFFDMPGHAAMGVEQLDDDEDVGVTFSAEEGRRFSFIETTETSFRLGELPEGIDKESVRIGHVIAAQEARKTPAELELAKPEEWRVDGRTLLNGSVLVTVLGSALAAFAWWLLQP